MFIKILTLFIICFGAIFQGDVAAAETADQKPRVITLKNDMKVVLKKTTFDPGEIWVSLTAVGGYASLPLKAIPSAQLAPQTALESGFQDITADHFFSEEIELTIDVTAYARRIRGYAEGSEINKLLDYIARYFKIRKFKPEAFNVAKAAAQKIVEGCKFDPEHRFHEAFLDLNTQHFDYLHHLEAKNIQNANIRLAEEIFIELFGNPEEFVVVIVGDFDEEGILKKLEETLGSIPKNETHVNYNNPPLPVFPSKSVAKEIAAYGETNSLASITYPIKSMTTEVYAMRNFIKDFLIHHLEDKLRKTFNEDFGIEVFLENPVYPRTEFPLIVIQYRCETYMLKKIQAAIIEEMKQVCKDGVDQKELDQFKKEQKSDDLFWMRDNGYWLNMLTQYHVLHWPMNDTTGTQEEYSHVNLLQVNNIIREIFCKDNYTFLYTKP